MPRKTASSCTVLQTATTKELLAELRRRALGCMVICVKAEEDGDTWHCALKGSSILLGAMSAALSMKTKQMLAGQDAV